MLLPGKTLLCIAQSSGEGSRERTFIAVGDIPHEQIAFYVSLLLRKKGSSRSHLQQSFFGRAFHVKKMRVCIDDMSGTVMMSQP